MPKIILAAIVLTGCASAQSLNVAFDLERKDGTVGMASIPFGR
jgi:hypothetical protein